MKYITVTEGGTAATAEKKPVETTDKNPVAYVELSRPEVRNAFDPVMIAEITQTFLALQKRTDLRAVVLKGAGKVFCAGADLQWMKEMVNFTLAENREDSVKLYNMFEAMRTCALPIIGFVQGAAFGGALGLVACCDYVISDPMTQFCFSEVKLGIAPAVISSFVLQKAVPGKIRHQMISGAVFLAQHAYEAGLVHEIATTADFSARLENVLNQYLECGPEAVRHTKDLLLNLPSLEWHEQKDRTVQLIGERRCSDEGQEGLKSFLEKRSPAWRPKGSHEKV
jgi:methylglutaconyl-CoA hydratase